MIDEIDIKFSACRSRLNKLEKSRVILNKQRRYLIHISQSFQSLVKASVDDTYNDSFLSDAEFKIHYQKRIRVVIQNLNLDFAERIAKQSHRREITSLKNINQKFRDVISITRNEFLDHMQHLMRRIRGRKLSEIFNSMIIVGSLSESRQKSVRFLVGESS